MEAPSGAKGDEVLTVNGQRVIRAAIALAGLALAALSPAQAAWQVFYHQDGRTVNNLAQAEALIAQTAPVAFQELAVRDISDLASARSRGRFDAGTTTLVPLSNRNHFAVYAVTEFVIPVAGLYTFLLHSDDGARLRLNGASIIQFSNPRSPGDSFSASQYLTAGKHHLDVVYFEQAGEAVLEVAIAAGTFTSFNAAAFSLIVASAPEPQVWMLMILGFVAVATRAKMGRVAPTRLWTPAQRTPVRVPVRA